MTDDGQAQNSLHANQRRGSNGVGERDRRPDLPRFHRVTKLCRTRPQPGMHFKTLEKLCRIQ